MGRLVLALHCKWIVLPQNQSSWLPLRQACFTINESLGCPSRMGTFSFSMKHSRRCSTSRFRLTERRGAKIDKMTDEKSAETGGNHTKYCNGRILR